MHAVLYCNRLLHALPTFCNVLIYLYMYFSGGREKYGLGTRLGAGGRFMQGEGSSENSNVQRSGWLRIHLPAITVQQQLQ